MNICFLLGSFELKASGVSDYVMGLAESCLKEGHTCSILAVNDSQTENKNTQTKESSSSIELQRIASAESLETKTTLCQNFLREQKVDTLSLQFVCYDLGHQGVIGDFRRLLKKLDLPAHRHIHFHELWIGASRGESVKRKVIGWLQRAYIESMLKELKPQTITTAPQIYQKILKERGVSSQILPLFGSVPAQCSNEELEKLKQKIATAIPELGELDSSDYLLFAAFGSLQDGYHWPVDKAFQQLAELAGKLKKKIFIAHIGNPREELWPHLSNAQTPFRRLGWAEPEEVTALFKLSNAALAFSSIDVQEKSSVITAMLEHGLAVLSARPDEPYGSSTSKLSPRVYKLSKVLKAPEQFSFEKTKTQPRQDEVSRKFLEMLKG